MIPASFEVPLDEVAEAVVARIWDQCRVSLAIKTCHQSIFEQLELGDEMTAQLPAVRVMEPRWEGNPANGLVSTNLPIREGRISYLIAYGRSFQLTDTSETWTRQLQADVKKIVAAVQPGSMLIPGLDAIDGLQIKAVNVPTIEMAASSGLEELGVRLAEAQIRLVFDVILRSQR